MASLDEARAVAVRLVGADPEKCAAYNVKRKRLYVFSAAAGTLARDLVGSAGGGLPGGAAADGAAAGGADLSLVVFFLQPRASSPTRRSSSSTRS